MDVVYTQCCGLDVHKKTVVACLITSTEGAEPLKEIRTFRTMTADLLAVADWLQQAGCTHVAMESTGVYWRPVYNLLEGQCELLVVNAQHIKTVPGRKTDVKDAAWIAELLRHGLLRGSFIPSKPQRQLRELTRYRRTLVQDHARALNRLHRTPMGEQGHHEHRGLCRGAQPIEDGAFTGAEGCVTRVAEEALLLLHMDTDIALARVTSGRAVLIGAECRRGVHAYPPSSVGERTKRSMSGPPFA